MTDLARIARVEYPFARICFQKRCFFFFLRNWANFARVCSWTKIFIVPLKNLFHTQVGRTGGEPGENRGRTGREPGGGPRTGGEPGGLQKNRGEAGGVQGRTGGEPGAVVSVYPQKQVLQAEEPGENRGGGEEPGKNRGGGVVENRGGGWWRTWGGGGERQICVKKSAFSQHIWSTNAVCHFWGAKLPQFWWRGLKTEQ